MLVRGVAGEHILPRRLADKQPGIVVTYEVFKSPGGEAEYRAAYDTAMRPWPVSFEDLYVPSRFGLTHGVVTAPREPPAARAAASVHGISDDVVAKHRRFQRPLSRLCDRMGQPSKSVPDEPIRTAADYRAWLTSTLNALTLDRVSLVGMSFGGWLALDCALASPDPFVSFLSRHVGIVLAVLHPAIGCE